MHKTLPAVLCVSSTPHERYEALAILTESRLDAHAFQSPLRPIERTIIAYRPAEQFAALLSCWQLPAVGRFDGTIIARVPQCGHFPHKRGNATRNDFDRFGGVNGSRAPEGNRRDDGECLAVLIFNGYVIRVAFGNPGLEGLPGAIRHGHPLLAFDAADSLACESGRFRVVGDGSDEERDVVISLSAVMVGEQARQFPCRFIADTEMPAPFLDLVLGTNRTMLAAAGMLPQELRTCPWVPEQPLQRMRTIFYFFEGGVVARKTRVTLFYTKGVTLYIEKCDVCFSLEGGASHPKKFSVPSMARWMVRAP